MFGPWKPIFARVASRVFITFGDVSVVLCLG
jgi:hypothetical protein